MWKWNKFAHMVLLFTYSQYMPIERGGVTLRLEAIVIK